MRRMYWMAMTLAAAGLALSATTAQAQGAPPPGAQDTAPASGALVARVSVMNGNISTQRGDTGDWTGAALNGPLVTGDKLASGEGSRAAVQLDFADFLRLSDNTVANFANLTDSQIQVQLAQGMADYVVLSGVEAASEIDTPNIAVHPQGAGVFRIQVMSDTETQVIVREGSAQITTPQGSTTLEKGQVITVQGTDDPQYQIADAPPLDDWDRWNNTQDARIANARSWANTNHYYVGAADLDGYGRWQFVPGYGQVWVPAVAAGWAPYSAGRWVWEPGWGWTWVAAEPWGWAPYHYGRWFVYGASWVWWPGPIATVRYRPVWAPAYVSFIGIGGGGASVGVGFGSMAWVAIGPGDPFRPWWGPRVGVVVVDPLVRPVPGRVVYANLTLMATDARVRGGVVAVDYNSFGRVAVDVSVRRPVTVEQIRTVTVIRGTVPVVPVRESTHVTERVVEVRSLPRAAAAPSEHFFGRAPAPAPVPFREQAARVQENIQHPEAVRASANANVRAGAAGATNNERPGWHGFGNNSGNAGAEAGRGATAGDHQPPAVGSGQSANKPGSTPPPQERAQTNGSEHQTQPQKDGNWHAFSDNSKKAPPPKDDKKNPPPKEGGHGVR